MQEDHPEKQEAVDKYKEELAHRHPGVGTGNRGHCGCDCGSILSPPPGWRRHAEVHWWSLRTA